MKNQLDTLKGREVEVDFHGTIYRGTFMDSSDEEVFLNSGGQWFSFPMEEISDIRLREGL